MIVMCKTLNVLMKKLQMHTNTIIIIANVLTLNQNEKWNKTHYWMTRLTTNYTTCLITEVPLLHFHSHHRQTTTMRVRNVKMILIIIVLVDAILLRITCKMKMRAKPLICRVLDVCTRIMQIMIIIIIVLILIVIIIVIVIDPCTRNSDLLLLLTNHFTLLCVHISNIYVDMNSSDAECKCQNITWTRVIILIIIDMTIIIINKSSIKDSNIITNNMHTIKTTNIALRLLHVMMMMIMITKLNYIVTPPLLIVIIIIIIISTVVTPWQTTQINVTKIIYHTILHQLVLLLWILSIHVKRSIQLQSTLLPLAIIIIIDKIRYMAMLTLMQWQKMN